MSLEDVAAQARTRFAAAYGRAPRWLAAAPGRVNLIGEHTDYNEGFVLPMAIERYTSVVAAPNGSRLVRLHSTATENVTVVDLSQPIEPEARGHWANYPKGVLAAFLKLEAGLPGFDALIDSTVPLGGGLSSSAALEVAMATLLEAVTGTTLQPARKALLCQQAEHEYAGVPCGVMDQFASIFGRADRLLLLDCRSLQTRWVQMPDTAVSVLIVNTRIKHSLASGEYALRRQQCAEAARALQVTSLRDVTPERLDSMRTALEPTLLRRARHVVSEIDRTVEAAARIEARDWVGAGKLMYASHASLQYDFEVSCPELDTVVGIARDIGPEGGVFGCRMTGGGFGGCAVALIRSEASHDIMERIRQGYWCRTGIEPAVFVSRPAAGATLIEPQEAM